MLRLTASGAFLIAATYGLARFALGLFVPEMRNALGLTSTAAGWLIAASVAGYIVALLVAGRLLVRLSTRAVAVAAGVAATLGTLGIATASTPAGAGLAAASGGLSAGWASTSLAAAVQVHIAPHQRPTSQTVINAGTSVGLVLAAAAATMSGEAWRLAWLSFAVVAIAATASVIASLPQRGTPADGPRRKPLLRPTSARLVATALLLGGSSATFWGFAREQLVSVASLSPGQGHSAWLALGLGGLAGAAAGPVTERYGLPPVLAVVWASFAIGHAWFANDRLPLLMALLAVAVIGAGYMSLTGLTILWAVREHPDEPGAGVATAFLIVAIGQAVASPLAGMLIDAAGLRIAFLAAALVAGSGVLARPARADRDASGARSERARTVRGRSGPPAPPAPRRERRLRPRGACA